MLFLRSDSKALAVGAMIGMCAVTGSALMCRVERLFLSKAGMPKADDSAAAA
jgi:hypothetical protein